MIECGGRCERARKYPDFDFRASLRLCLPSIGRYPPLRAGKRNSPIRIVIIAPPWVAIPPRAYGGTESVLDTLARGLHNAGHDVLLFTTGDSTCPVPTASVLPHAIGVGVGGSATEMRHVIHAYQAAR